MQNLSISCALVCLIVLGSAALVGAFGVCKHQISAVLVTGVMYLLAGMYCVLNKYTCNFIIISVYDTLSALFALFTLMIIHFKRQQGKPRLESEGDGTIDGIIGNTYSIHQGTNIAQHLLSARIFTTSWSLDLGWGGVVLCAVTSFFWILLSKIMRFNPISAILV